MNEYAANLGAPLLPSTSANDAAGLARANGFIGGADRPDSNGRDLVAAFAQNFKAVAIEGEGLARLGDGLRLVDDEASDRGGLIVRQRPVHLAVEIAYRHRAVDVDRAISLQANGHVLGVVLIGDLTDDLLKDVLERDQALH